MTHTRTLTSAGRRRAALLAAASALALPALAPATANAQALEEIIVVAQKREQSLIDVPISVSAFSGRALRESQINTAEDLALHTPNLNLVPQASGNTTYAVSMRGLQQADSVITADSPVGIYVDGVVVGKLSGGIFDFIDLERVEVLRGPQGTLYGRNTPAGAINLITRKPSGQAGGEITAGIGTYNARDVRIGLDTPSVDLGSLGSAALRLSGRFFKRDGWAHNARTDRDLDSRDRQGGRVALRWTVNPDLVVDYTFDKARIRERPPAATLTFDGSGFLGSFVSKTAKSEFQLSYDLAKPDLGPYGIGAADTKLDLDTHAVTVDYKVADNFSLKSITGFRKMYDEEPTDFDGTPVAWADFNAFNKLDTVSEELQANGQAMDGQLSYVAGAFYYREQAKVRAPGVFGFGTVKQEPRFETDNDAWAGYGQVEYSPDALDRKLTLAVGGRYTYENKELKNDILLLNDTTVLANVASVKKSFKNFSPSVFVSYKLRDDLNSYFRWARGWRSGGFNGRSSTNAQIQTPFGAEKLDSYEIGLKGSPFGPAFSLNLAGFLSNYRDLQTVLTSPAVTGVGFQTTNSNIGRVQITGIEAEAALQVTDDLLVNGAYSYIHTNTKSYSLCLPVDVPGCVFTNLGNSRTVALTPTHSFTVSLDYTFLKTSYGQARVHFDANWRSDQVGGGQIIKTVPRSSDLSFIPSYTMLDGRVVFEKIPVGGNELAVAGWVKNLLNERSPQFAVNLTSSLGIATTRFLTPRMFGVDLSFRF